MKNYRDKIMLLVDGSLTEKEKKVLTEKIKTDMIIKKEFELQQDIEEYMSAKYLIEEAENDIKILPVQENVHQTVKEEYSKNSPDFEVIDYLSTAFYSSDTLISRELKNIEIEAEETGIFDLTKLWAEEYHDNISFKDMKTVNYIEEGFKIAMAEDNKGRPVIVSDKRKLIYILSSVAAAVLILFLLNIMVFNKQSNQEIFADYYQTYDLIGVQVRNNSNQNVILRDAFNAYSEKDFEKASTTFKRYIETDNTLVQAYFYLGISQIETNSYKEALNTFEQIITNFDEYEIESKWYSALCFIYTEEYNKAKILLEQISVINCIYQKDAQKLLKLLN